MTDLENWSDEALLIDIQNETRLAQAAFEEFYRRHHARVGAFLRKKYGDVEFVNEATQIAFWKIFEKRKLYRPEDPALAWLFVIAKSEAKDHFAKEKRHLKGRLATEESEQFFSTQTSQNAPSNPKDLQEEFADLSPDDLSLLEARYMEGLSFQELARRWGQSEASLRKRVSRLFAKIRGSATGGTK